MSLPLVAVIGRPNVGKSTLFNCLVKQKKAIVSHIPGTTRDSLMERVRGDKVDYWIIDTAGLRNEKGETLEEEIQTQAHLASQNADVILFMIDGKAPLTADDHNIIDLLRKKKKPLLFVANKVDDGGNHHLFEYAEFGFGIPLAISAKNYTGMWELEDALETLLTEQGFGKEEDSPMPESVIRVAFLGRPNVGKSSLLNQVLGETRSIVSDIAGTTRDTISVEFTDEEKQKYIFLDTAGLRRPGKIEKDLEFWSTVRTKRSLEDCHIAVLLIDALDGVTHQDLALAGSVIEAGKGLIIGVNKFDLVREKTRAKMETDERELDEVQMWGKDLDAVRKEYWHYLHKKIPFASWAPVVFFSAKTGKGVSDLFETFRGIFTEMKKRVSTAEINRFIPDIYYGHVTPMVGTKRGVIKYVSQVDTVPPKFLFFVNNKKAFHFSYRRYVENKLREKFGFYGSPIRVEFRDAMESHEARKSTKKGKKK